MGDDEKVFLRFRKHSLMVRIIIPHSQITPVSNNKVTACTKQTYNTRFSRFVV